ncbi:hypothetical protein BU25DRAFT_161090 [Macroventuria anomochaeta]|uniref:Uncharacterized protein n=1 Tax=Macroventuria anomochaeta TaxID=301207 RepID=A0ACB6RSR3_9PLEO|nr:uncharacterized protein BU25DRAFT_161090 [Macroventuria anomochaeta]KAF2624430.1 hypothetical protein BU25DRAFT_161090 [Macroventuria anomochaeta]
MYPHTPLFDINSMVNRLNDENNVLKAQLHSLTDRVSHLEVENAHLRSLIARSPPPPPSPAAQVYATPSDNAMHLPMVVESLAVMQEHFRRQGTLKQCSTTACHRYAFDQICFREGHMAWCHPHNRIITRTYTSCSVKAEERGDCMPVSWEDRHDWAEIVARAFRDGKIGHKGLESGFLKHLLFSPIYGPQRTGPPVSLPQGQYPHGDWA